MTAGIWQQEAPRTDRSTDSYTALGYWRTPVAVLTKRSVKKAGCVHSFQRQFDYEALIRTIYTRNGYTPESHNVTPSSFPGEMMEDLWWIKWNWKRILSERFDFLLSVSFQQCFILSPFIYSFIHSSIPHRPPTPCNLVWSFRHSPNLLRNTNPQGIEYKWSITAKHNSLIFVIQCCIFQFNEPSSGFTLQFGHYFTNLWRWLFVVK